MGTGTSGGRCKGFLGAPMTSLSAAPIFPELARMEQSIVILRQLVYLKQKLLLLGFQRSR